MVYLTCKRCEDIHLAQKDGKTQESCKCNCHNSFTNTGTLTTALYNTSTSDGHIDFITLSPWNEDCQCIRNAYKELNTKE